MANAGYMSIHNLTDAVVRSYHPKNSNCVALVFLRADGGVTLEGMELSLFGLPDHKALALVKALGTDETTVFDGGVSQSLPNWLATKDVYDKLEGAA